MQIKIKDIKENPYRKELGKYNEDQIKKIVESFKMSDFATSQRFEVRFLKIVKDKEIFPEYQLIYGHHRLEALKRYLKNNDYEVEIIIRDYNDEKMLVEMLRENLVKDNDWYLKMRALTLVKKFLIEKLKKSSIEVKDIIKFISKDELLFSHKEANSLLNIAENLAPELLNKVVKTESIYAIFEDKDVINLSQAKALALFKDKEEQKDLANVLKNSIIQKTHEQLKLLQDYKNASINIKNKIRSGEIDLVAVKNFQIERKERKEFSKIIDEKKKVLSANQEALYIYNCLVDAIKSIQKLNFKKLDAKTIYSLDTIYKKTIRVLNEYIKKEDET